VKIFQNPVVTEWWKGRRHSISDRRSTGGTKLIFREEVSGGEAVDPGNDQSVSMLLLKL